MSTESYDLEPFAVSVVVYAYNRDDAIEKVADYFRALADGTAEDEGDDGYVGALALERRCE